MESRAHNAGTQVFKPSVRALVNGPIIMVVLIAALSTVAIFIRADAQTALIFGAAWLFLLPFVVVVLLRARLEISPGTVTHRRTFGSVTVPAAALDRVIWLPALESANMDYIVTSRVVGVDRSGKAAFRITSRIWSKDAVLAVANALAHGTRVVQFDQRCNVNAVKPLEPEALSWAERNPIRAAAAYLAIFLLVVMPVLFGLGFLITGADGF